MTIEPSGDVLPPDFAARADAAGLGSYAEDLARLARPAVVLRADPADPAAGALGGVPLLPPGMSWPRSSPPYRGDKPLTFIASLNLARLPRSVWGGPPSGTLSLFALFHADGMSCDGGAVVLHHSADAELVPTPPPSDLAAELHLHEVPVRSSVTTTLPWSGVGPARELIPIGLGDEAGPDASERYTAFACEVAGSGPWDASHQVGGWPRFVQDDIRDEWAHALAHLVARGLSHGLVPLEEWELLLQVRQEGRLGAEFGDGGTVLFGIPRADLVAARFDRVQVVSQSG